MNPDDIQSMRNELAALNEREVSLNAVFAEHQKKYLKSVEEIKAEKIQLQNRIFELERKKKEANRDFTPKADGKVSEPRKNEW